MKIILAMLFAAVLAGCTTIQEVKVPIPTPCVKDVPMRPALLSEQLPAVQTEADAASYVKAVWIDLQEFQSYSDKLEVVIAGCPKLEEK